MRKETQLLTENKNRKCHDCASFRGDIDIINCTIQGNKSYRGGTDSSNYGKMHTTLYLIQSGYSSNYKGKYVEGNASAYPYLKWDFGYTCYMPQNIYVENMVVGNAAAGAKLYMFNNLADAMFVKPSDFVQTGEVAEELYYNQYQITKSITYKGMEPLQMSPSKRTQLWSIPVYTLE